MAKHLRSFCVTELGSFDLNPIITTLSLFPHFCANMLPFSITVGPDEQSLGVFGLVSNVFCNWQFVLRGRSVILLDRQPPNFFKPYQHHP